MAISDELKSLIDRMLETNASDLILTEGQPPIIRVAGDLRPVASGRAPAIEALRRLGSAVEGGSELYAVAWTARTGPVSHSLKAALFDGSSAGVETLRIRRSSNGMKASRTLIGSRMVCPARAVCIDRDRRFRSDAYASFDADGSLKIGTRASFNHAGFAVAMGESGPRVAVSLPLGRWLGLHRWVPFVAQVRVSLGGVSFKPKMESRD